MKIFEFAFNPKQKKDRLFKLYSYEPKSVKEKPKGSLYIAGELDNALEFNARLLGQLARTLQEAYYSSPLKGAGPALKNALKQANAFLAKEAKRGNVDWLGNLHVAVLLFLTVKEKKTMFHIAKAGNVKIYLQRGKTLVDIAKNLEAGSPRQPGKIFSNLASAALVPQDSILALSKDVFDIFSKEKSLPELASLQEAKEFREFFARRQRLTSQCSGLLLSVIIEEETAKRPRKKAPLLSLPSSLPSLPRPKLMLPKGVAMPPLPAFLHSLKVRHPSAFKKQAVLVVLFLALLLLGVLLFS